MGGPGEPPEGAPEGGPGGGEDEYRSVVFDESFVRAARLQEYSAQERMADHAPAVRRRPPMRRGLSRQALVLVLLIALAFGTAIYMGVRHPYQTPAAVRDVSLPLQTTVVPLAPVGKVPGAADPEYLYDHSPAAQFRIGAAGITLPAARDTSHFSETQVMSALDTVKEYLVRSALYPEVLTGGETRPVRVLLPADQHLQFDESLSHPAADGRHAVTGWLVRFDARSVRLADPQIRVRGTLAVSETESTMLEVTADHTYVYALRPAGADAKAEASLFTVRRELHFRFDREDVRLHQAQLSTSYVQAGPLSCGDNAADVLSPLLAGQTAKAGGPVGTDPFATDRATAVCGTLASGALPKG
ncbi:SCO2583 family membrane protein [Streptomyces justiciae]|uniref:Uncharacterized protein n=1 Tax=Streptomyces justiciae TaxID=2780140 RepID=A0ABU3LTI6_9ACTN|nr:hypothetical protein [Streptomyces justiciae]MDT7842393.1 hypothetical protein [Streptomyces justiciae]